MAQITGAVNEKIFQLKKWLGINENPGGDTKLKMGEAAIMRNWRITRDGNLQKRPGTREVLQVSAERNPIKAVWYGYVAATERVMVITDDKLYSCWNGYGWQADEVGSLGTVTADTPHMFGFADKLYILTGSEYYCWDGETLQIVSGYVPLVATAITPNGGGELLEQVNKLNGKRRVWLSPDGTGVTFAMPENDLVSFDSVTKTTDGTAITGYTVSLVDGTITFDTAPAAAANAIEVAYTVSDTFRSEVVNMRFSETYNGNQDTRVFLYGDGTNTALYSDIDYWGQPSAEYFPDQNEMEVGVSNTPITGMIRHYSRMVAYKPDGTWTVQYGLITLADGDQIPAFYTTPVNRTIGNEAPGQVQLVLNSPVTLFGSDAYQWTNSSYYTSNLTADERQARRISDRVYSSIRSMDTERCICFDDNFNQEYYIIDPDGEALVWGYAADAWYIYTDFPMYKPFSLHGELYYGSTVGGIQHVSNYYAGDQIGDGENEAINCYWESGAMSFGADYQRKYSAMLWIGVKPEMQSHVTVTVQTDKTAAYTEKVVETVLYTFDHVNFADFSFAINRRPQMKRLKIKAKKFVFYKLILKSENNDKSACVVSADFRVRFTGYAK